MPMESRSPSPPPNPKRLSTRPAAAMPSAIGIAAAGRVDNRFGFGGGDGDLLSIGIDQRTVRSQRDDQRFHALCDLVQCLAGFVLQHLGFVIVYGDVSGPVSYTHLRAHETGRN